MIAEADRRPPAVAATPPVLALIAAVAGIAIITRSPILAFRASGALAWRCIAERLARGGPAAHVLRRIPLAAARTILALLARPVRDPRLLAAMRALVGLVRWLAPAPARALAHLIAGGGAIVGPLGRALEIERLLADLLALSTSRPPRA